MNLWLILCSLLLAVPAWSFPLGWNQNDSLHYGMYLRATFNECSNSGNYAVNYANFGFPTHADIAMTVSNGLDAGLSFASEGANACDGTMASLVANSPLTVTMWFRMDATNSYSTLFHNNSASSGAGLAFNYPDSRPYLDCTWFAVADNYMTNIYPLLSHVYFFALSYDGTNVAAYLFDKTAGTNISQTIIPATTPGAAANWISIGKSSFGRYFLGVIDDAKVYSRVLSKQDILQLYNGGYGIP